MKYSIFAMILLVSSAAIADDAKLPSNVPDAEYIHFCEHPGTKDQITIDVHSGQKCPEGYERFMDINGVIDVVVGFEGPHQQSKEREPNEE